MSAFLDLPEQLGELFKEIQRYSLPSRSSLSEEEQYIPPYFSEIGDESEPVEISEDGSGIVNVETKGQKEIKFEAFLDGVQRTVIGCWIHSPNWALVPIHIAQICVGVILRDKNGALYIDPELLVGRFLLVGPFEGLRRAGFKIETFDKIYGEVIYDTDYRTFDLPSKINEWIVCDTTFRGTDVDRERSGKGLLIGDELFNESLIRMKALGRVAMLRQRLEIAVLARFRKKYPKKWILVDGPLYLIDKWRKRAFRVLGKEIKAENEYVFEDKLLKNAVGIIKTHRLRPKNPDQVIKIKPTQRSVVKPLHKEIDIKGQGNFHDEDGSYAGIHFTWYTRLRAPLSPPYGLMGLIRLDIHRSTLGLDSNDLIPMDFIRYKSIIDAITRAVWRERWPAIPRGNDYRSASEPYPIYQLERILKATILPRRYLAGFLSL
jgi:hypothetical protein